MSNCNPIKSRLNILQVNTTDLKGGAARVCYDLHRSYLSKDIRSWMAVGKKESCDPKIFEISSLSNTKKTLIKTNETRSSSLINHNNFSNLMDKIIRLWERKMGKEIFRFPETYKILEALPGKPSLIHFHNLHGNYFDLRAFSKLSKKFPLLLTLHDAWMLSGHCAHSIECDRWEIGCGKCPDLSIYPAIERDKTAYNWKRKRKIYNDSKFYVATPCKWLADKVVKSMLKESVISLKVIPNGVDLSVFNSLDKQKAKKKIGIKENERVVLCSAQDVRNNPWKDFETIRSTIGLLKKRMPEHPLRFIALGESGNPEKVGDAMIEFREYVKDVNLVAQHFKAADVYVHAALADTFPTTILEQ